MAVQGVSQWERRRIMGVVVVLLVLCLSAASSDSNRNYYETLSVDRSATDVQIKRAFRKLAVKYHPDKNKGADAEKTFREILEAYSVLSNKEKRRYYDSVGHNAFVGDEEFAHSEDHENTPFSFAEFFHDFNDSPFGEEWPDLNNFQDWENEEDPFEPHQDPAGFTFVFRHMEENEGNEDDFHNHYEL